MIQGIPQTLKHITTALTDQQYSFLHTLVDTFMNREEKSPINEPPETETP